MGNPTSPTVQSIRNLRANARAMQERSKLSLEEAEASERHAEALEKTLTPEEKEQLNPSES